MTRIGHKFVRYADDFSVYCKSHNQAKAIQVIVEKFLKNKLKLTVNQEKSGVKKPVNFTILGFSFVPVYKKGSKNQYQLVVAEKPWKRLKERLKRSTRKTTPAKFDERITKIKEVQRGWLTYFRGTNSMGKLRDIDGWLRNRLRYCIWHDWKKPERKRKNLIRLGIDQDHAYAGSRTRKGEWAIPQSPILGTTITLKRLKKRGYLSLTELYIQFNPSLCEPPSAACPDFYRDDSYARWCERLSLLVSSGAVYSIGKSFLCYQFPYKSKNEEADKLKKSTRKCADIIHLKLFVFLYTIPQIIPITNVEIITVNPLFNSEFTPKTA